MKTIALHGSWFRVLGWLLVVGLAWLPARSMRGAPAATDGIPGPAQRIVFMLDLSGSMPKPYHPEDSSRPRLLTFGERVGAAREKAREILDHPAIRDKSAADVQVGFWTFGEWKRVEVFESFDAMSVAEARDRLDAFFSEDPDQYDHQRTYIACSIAELAQRLFGSEDAPIFETHRKRRKVERIRDIPADAGSFYVYVFTDGHEDPDRGFDNTPCAEWLQRQRDRLQIHYERWKLPDDALPPPKPVVEPRPGPPAPPTSDHVVYDVRFGAQTDAFLWDPRRPPATNTVQLEVPRLIRLVPSLSSREDPLAGLVDDEGPKPLVCTTPDALPAERPEQTLLVQARIDWGTTGPGGATSEWSLPTAARSVARDADGDLTGDHPIDRSVLRLEAAPNTPAVLPGAEVPDGQYPVRFVYDSLCRELSRAYPNSTFVLPVDDAGDLLPLGWVSVRRTVRYEFVLDTQEGAAPDAVIGPIGADRWHCYAQHQRTFRLVPPAGVTADVDFSVAVGLGGEALENADDLVTLSTGEARGGSVTAPAGSDVTLSTPADAPPWWKCQWFGLDRAAGDYEFSVCARPVIRAAPAKDFEVVVRCPQCADTGKSATNDALCVRFRAPLEAKPFSYLAIVLAALAILIVLWITVRWKTRPQFPPRLFFGSNPAGQDLRTAHGDGLEGVLVQYRRKPLFVGLKGRGRTSLNTSSFRTKDEKAQLPVVEIGVRPGPEALGEMLLWCSHIPEAQDGRTTTVHVSVGTGPLRPSRREPGLVDPNMRHVRYADVRRGGVTVTVERQGGPGGTTTEEYPIEFK